MCADKAKEKGGNPQTSGEPEQETGNEFYVGGPKTDSDAAGKLRRLFESSKAQPPDPQSKKKAQQTAARLPALPAANKKPDPNSTMPRLPAVKPAGKDSAVKMRLSEKAAAETKTQRPPVVKSGKMNVRKITMRTLTGNSKQSRFKLSGDVSVLQRVRERPRCALEQPAMRVSDTLPGLDLKNFKGHVFLRKDSMQEFAYRIKEVSRDWDDFRFVDPADDIEWHRSSLNQALNDFAVGLLLPTVQLSLDEKAQLSIEPQYKLGHGIIIVRPDDIRNASNVDIAALYHEFLHAEQDATIIRQIALSIGLYRSADLNSAEVLSQYCGQTALHTESVSRDWINTVLLASTDWIKRKSDDIKKILKKHPTLDYDQAFAKDRELLRANELTEAVFERSLSCRHLMRKHQLLVYLHRQFTQNLEPHVYVEKFQAGSFQRLLFGYDTDESIVDSGDKIDDTFSDLLAAKPQFIRNVLFGRTDDWLSVLPAGFKLLNAERLTRLKMIALARAFDVEVKDRTDSTARTAFNQKYREAAHGILIGLEHDFAEQIRLKNARHFLGVELELEANHAAHLMHKLHGEDKDSVIDSRIDESLDDFMSSLNELNEKLPQPKEEELPEVPVEHSGQSAVVVQTGPMGRIPADVVIAKNRRVTYRGQSWLVADFNQDTGDVILHRSAEKSIEAKDVFIGDRPLSINESYRIRIDDHRSDEGWIYRGRDEAGNLRMFKSNAERIEVPKLALISVNQLLANAKTPCSVSMTNLPRFEAPLAKEQAAGSETQKSRAMSWTGCYLGLFLIEELLSDRQFYWVYSGSDQSTFEKKVFKVAKPIEYLANMESMDPLKSTVLKLSSVGFSTVTPSVSELLKLQCERMSHDNNHVMAKIEEVVFTEALCYSRMEFIDGVTLRELRKHGALSLELALDIVAALESIQANPALRYHGDLTPDNIMISYSSVKLLDAGYFGALDCVEGMVEDAAITTPAYYPFLTPNDMLALGVIFWELHFGKNPFSSFDENPIAPAGVSQALVRVLKGYSSIGRPFVNSMSKLSLPRHLEPKIHPELERFLLASLGLRVNENQELDVSGRFETFAQMAEALRILQAHGITEL